ncbi:hypothetical protein GOP47_0008620 [Adiantum capillus-veneris]|uniref:Peroxisomal membrane protein 11A n=1 Tax=Adiantum capillus-veneris TaxID=13818 RepID=A0A9D4ZKW9_ADICA|nr:hypothetical protein GOP47_0008620 [Adiantum capillus-veneris]
MAKAEGARRDRAFLDHLEAYLSRRDGVDKLLKITRYTCKFLLATPLLQSSPVVTGKGTPPALALLTHRLKDFEASVGTSRKAFRLGKFIQDVNALRATPSFSSREGLLEIVAYGGEGIYYFIEQFVWLVKAGLLDKRHQKSLQLLSAWAEFIGYFGSVTLKSLQVQAMLAKELELLVVLSDGKDKDDVESYLRAATALAEVRQKRALKTLSLIQDAADALLALSDIRDGKGFLSNPLILSSCGLLSALISTHKNWSAC